MASSFTNNVSYIELFKNWFKEDKQRNKQSTIPVGVVFELYSCEVLTKSEFEAINRSNGGEATDEEKLAKLLFNILPSKNEYGFNQLVKILFELKCDRLANDLLRKIGKGSTIDSSSNEPTEDVIAKKKMCLRKTTSSIQTQQMEQAQKHLACLRKKKVNFMPNYWSKHIPFASGAPSLPEKAISRTDLTCAPPPPNQVQPDAGASTVNAQVIYVDVYARWIKEIRKLSRDSIIPIQLLLTELKVFDVLSLFEYQLVENEKTNDNKVLKLFKEIMPGKGENGFSQVVEILMKNKYIELANGLVGKLNKQCSTNLTFSNKNPRILQAQAHLSRLIKDNIDFMAKYWSDVIRVAKTQAAFVQIQVLEHFKSENGNPVGSYCEVFDVEDEKTIHKRILIQADPGCGKTTYVNKLALDWANEDEYLRGKFDFVFLIPLQTLTMDVFDTIKWFLPDKSEQFFASYAKSCDAKILLILDGFDELVKNSEWYSSVMNILNVQSKQFQFFHVIVTTRRSHADKIPQQFHGRSLLIKGFNEESMKQFLDKQHVPLSSVGQQSNLSRLLQTPLFCAIYCSLHFGGGDPIELEDSYDVIKALVENSVTNTIKKKTVENEEDQLDEIGKFAFQMLDSKSLNFLKEFCRSSKVIKPSFDLSRVNLDLLIKRRIPTRGVGNFKEEFSLPHQLIAEYLAARYFARSLTEEQLKQADASALIHDFNYHVLDLSFVRFFLFELLFLDLKKNYEKNVFENFLKIARIRFIWNCKSNKDISTLDNVSDLNFYGWNRELVNHSRLIPTLSKCRHLSSLKLARAMSKNQVEQLTELINNNCFQKIIKLYLGWNENVGSTPQLFTALCKCKHLQLFHLYKCEMAVESINELAKCIDNSGLSNLKELYLFGNENVGSSTNLFHVLHKCWQLQRLNLEGCSITQESLNIFLSTFNSNSFQQLDDIWLRENKDIKIDDNFLIALEKCPKISTVYLSISYYRNINSDLSEVGRKAIETLKERGCRFCISS